MSDLKPIRGRGASSNPPNRFEKIRYEDDPDREWDPEEEQRPETMFLRDPTRTIITYNDSPDVGFESSVNPYRGCEHGCIYCFARPTHEYLSFSAGLDFETKILVKEDAPRLLREELLSPKWKPQVIAMSGVTDCYQPIEKKLRLTRGCLEVLAEFRNPVVIITKNHLVTRDVDLLAELAAVKAAAVFISVTTLDAQLARKMEPRTSSPDLRLDAVRILSRAGVPTGVLVAPIIPAITDHEIPGILKAAAAAGATSASYTILRLPHAVAPLFVQWLEEHFPEKKDRVISRIQELRGGKLNDPRFSSRQRGEGIFSEQIKSLFAIAKRKAGLADRSMELSAGAFRRPARPQMELF